MIDYEKETSQLEMEVGMLTDKEIYRQFELSSQKAWRFLSENVILRESVILNKHQKMIKDKAR